ncbi:Som1 protein [Apiospora kogelbergensis]|uniref:Som1 protein n=1 Tax=Apiospora kogelbergensis TaxID=1337665 RepID=UPI00312E8846
MNNVNMANMGAMGGPVGGAPIPMAMNNGNGALPAQPMQGNDRNHRCMLNTYIYDYFMKEGMYDCARSLLRTDQPLNVSKDSPGSRRDENGNALNGVSDDSMEIDHKHDVDSKDLPTPLIASSETCFLYEWFGLFWDMHLAQRNRGNNNMQVSQYINHTQTQNRLKQSQQQELLRSMRPDQAGGMAFNPMMRNMANGMQMPNNTLARKAMANNQNPQMMLQQKQNQMQRDPSDMDGNRRPASPGSAENAPSPNKRPRLEGNTPFNPQQAAMMPNGRPQQGMPGQQQVSNTSTAQSQAQTAQLLIANNINPNSLTPQQFQNFQNQPPANQQKSIATYAQNMAGHHGNQMPNKAMGPGGVPQGQGSPMMNQPNGAELNTFYNAEGLAGAQLGRGAPGNPQGGGSNHALQDYQMQLMLLEQQNKKRLMMARQEQDNLGGSMPRGDGAAGPGGPGGPPGPNGQPFPDASPQGGRAGASPNPSEQMKRGTPQMNPAGIPSPLPEGGQSRGSPNPMSFMPPGDPNMAPHFFTKGMNGMEGNMVQMNGGGMRPPSSHPGQTFNGGQMNPQQMMAARQGQPGPGGPQMQWQGPNGGNPMVPQGPQGQVQGTPQQRAMPPPSAPAPGVNANGRTQPSSPAPSNAAPPTPQQSNKAAPKKKDAKGAKGKAAAKKANNAAGATPAAEQSQEPEPPTPATPITPVNPGNFAKNGPNAGAGQPAPNAQASAPAPAPVAPPVHADPSQGFGMDNQGAMDFGMEFANPLTSDNVLQDFDFDSFLHDGDGGDGGFDFNPSTFMEGAGEIGAE